MSDKLAVSTHLEPFWNPSGMHSRSVGFFDFVSLRLTEPVLRPVDVELPVEA